jgi:hypothetical protein
MSIQGSVILEDTTISFLANYDGECVVHISDTLTGEHEHMIVPSEKFFKALAIAVHSDGMPDYNVDYEDAESIQGKIRWIP